MPSKMPKKSVRPTSAKTVTDRPLRFALPELLAPVGDRACFHAALEAGADALYLGLGRFNMRRALDGKLEPNQLPGLVREAHARGVKLYLTLNTIVYQGELAHLQETLEGARRAGVDAVIASDWAVIVRAKALGLPVHVSTQMSASNADAVRFLAAQGAERVVLARECTLAEIATIARETEVPLEVFAHGAQCVATSGRCFLSQVTYGCSASRGQCLQPCRRRYRLTEIAEGEGPTAEFEVGAGAEGGFLLSAKDLCTLPILPDLVRAGVASLKIEGRARNPEYVDNVVRAYRTALNAIARGTYDEACQAACQDLVNRVYHRPFAQGLLLGRPGGANQFAGTDANLATECKRYLGVVRNYYARAGVVDVLIHDGELRPGDRLAFHGPKTGVLACVPSELHQDALRPDVVRRGDWVTFRVPARLRPGDKVYRILPATPSA